MVYKWHLIERLQYGVYHDLKRIRAKLESTLASHVLMKLLISQMLFYIVTHTSYEINN